MTDWKEPKLKLSTLRSAYNDGNWRKFSKRGQFRNMAVSERADNALKELRNAMAHRQMGRHSEATELENKAWPVLTEICND